MPQDTYTHGHHESVLRSHSWRTAENSAGYLLPHLAPGMEVLDIGCGPGTITNDFGRLVAPGNVTGVDISEEIVAQARSAPHPSNVAYEVANVYSLPYAEGSFDIVHAHQLHQHLSDPIASLREIRRVLRPTGIAAVRDSDHGGFMWYPEDPVLTEWIELYLKVTKRNNAEAKAGRYLLHWATEAGFAEPRLTCSTWVFADASTREWWGGLWADRILHSTIAEQAISYGLATPEKLQQFSDAFRRWSSAEDSVFVIPQYEVIAKKG